MKVVYLFMAYILPMIYAFEEGQLEGEPTNFVSITTDKIISNAKSWLNPCVPYSQSSYHAGL